MPHFWDALSKTVIGALGSAWFIFLCTRAAKIFDDRRAESLRQTLELKDDLKECEENLEQERKEHRVELERKDGIIEGLRTENRQAWARYNLLMGVLQQFDFKSMELGRHAMAQDRIDGYFREIEALHEQIVGLIKP